MSELISIREYARRLEISDVAVLKAIKAGKIVKAVDYTNPKRPKIDPVLASEEWGKNYNPAYDRSEKLKKALKVDEQVGTPLPPPDKASVMQEAVNEVTNQKHEPQAQGSSISIAEAKRQSAIYDAKLKGLELAERQKVLVPRDKVYRELFALGQEIRTGLQAIPDKYIDNILACKTRSEAHALLYNAITEALEGFSNEIRI